MGSARAYHAATAHTPRSVRSGDGGLDWDNRPSPFKIYPDLSPLALPTGVPALGRDALEALGAPAAGPGPLDLDALAAVLFFSAGITKAKTYPGGEKFYFRAAASTGALYQTEVYLVAGRVRGLAPGVYHFGPGDFALRQLREGDFRGTLAEAAGAPGLAQAPATLVLTGIYWRNAWKYGARAYRHLFWDAGTMLANVLAVAAALPVPAQVVTGFVDAEVNRLLGLDPAREGALLLVPLGTPAEAAPAAPPLTPIDPAVIPLSRAEVDHPLVREAYAASTLASPEAVTAWRTAAPGRGGGARAPERLLTLPPARTTAGRALGETILARGSTREFSGAAIPLEALSTALHHATQDVPADRQVGPVDLYCAVHAVEGLAPGAYMYHPTAQALELLREGDVRAEAAFLCLEQPLGGASSVTVFFLADLARTDDRGYRLVNLAAGLAGGRLYLSAYAQRFGATGLTFYDDAVAAFFAPHAAGKDAIFVTALGRSVRAGARRGGRTGPR